MSVNYLKSPADSHSVKAEQAASIALDSLALDPFANTRDSRFYFGSVSHQAALTQLQAMLDDSSQCWGSLSSAPCLGKTLLRTVLHKSLDPLRYVGISIETSLLNFDELLLEIISQISGARVYPSEFPDRYSRLSEFKLVLTEHVVRSGRHLVLLIDEAHGLSEDTLEGLRNLSNICAAEYNLMSFVLIGGRRLESTLRGLPELSQRIAVRTSLMPLDADQTGAYLQHRLDVAGCQQPIPFSAKDLKRLHQVSRGIPSEINIILKQAINIARLSATGLGADSLQEALNVRSAIDASQNTDLQNLGMI